MPGEFSPQIQELIQDNTRINELLQVQAEQSLTTLHRPIEQLGARLGRPVFVIGALACVALWVGVNLLLLLTHHTPWDAPPFGWLQGLLGLLGLFITATVLVGQARQGQVNEQRAQLLLQVVLLTEQRSAKIVELLETLRRDLPNVRNRVDREAETLSTPSDPEAIIAALNTLQDPEPESLPPE